MNYGPSSARLRRDYARCASGNTAIECSVQAFIRQHGLNRKTAKKWRGRDFVHDVPMEPKVPRSTVLTPAEEAMAVAFRRHTLRRSTTASTRCR